jgi:hypothetical protein
MAAGPSVTWTHSSDRFEVTWGKTLRPRASAYSSVRTHNSVRADALQRPRGHGRPRQRTHSLPRLPSPSLPSPLPCGRSLLSVRTRGDVRADARKKIKQNKKFGFQSPKSPKSPNSPSSAGFAGEAARRRRFFRPSSPSHPSKLYSSLGWLNSKVPKPFPPFSVRLIDVDGF